MARKYDLSDPATRDALPTRSSYYSHDVGSGCYVLLRKSGKTPKWGARLPRTDFADRVLGPVESMSFSEASALVHQLHSNAGLEKPAALHTFGDALRAYEQYFIATKSDRSYTSIAKHFKVAGQLSGKLIAATEVNELNHWLQALVTDKVSPTTANKYRTTLMAALERHGIDGPWRKFPKLKVRKNKSKTKKQYPYFTPDHARTVIHFAHHSGFEYAYLCEALWLTGARPSELTEATKDQFQGRTLILSGKTDERTIVCSPKVRAFFERRAAECNTHLIERSDGTAIQEGHYTHPLRRFLDSEELAGKIPQGSVAYSFRHGFISSAIYAGVPIFPLADHCGTSVQMIQDTYGHVIAEKQAEAFLVMDDVL